MERASLSTHNDAEEINCKKTVLMEKRWTGCGYGALGYASVELGGELVEIGGLAGGGSSLLKVVKKTLLMKTHLTCCRNRSGGPLDFQCTSATFCV